MSVLNKYLSERDDNTLLMRFAFTGVKERFDRLINDLATLAEEEPWTQFEDYDILKTYINKTFEKCFHQGDISVKEDEESCCFDTGLLSRQLEKIYGYFEKNDRGNPYWKLIGFYTESNMKIIDFPVKPKKADYFSNPNEYYFNTELDITMNSIHILEEDHVTERFPEDIKNLPLEDLIAMIRGKIGILKDRIERNPRIVIPLYYKEKITFACPINILSHTLALIIEKSDSNNYRINTIFTLDIAYKKARILMKPESNWLLINKKKEST